MLDNHNTLQIVFDKDVVVEDWYGCSDGSNAGYMKIRTAQIINNFLPFVKHTPTIIAV